MEFFVDTGSDDGRLKLKLSGRFDFNGSKVFRHACDEGMTRIRSGNIEVDFEGVDYMDSSALGMLLLFKDLAEKENRKITLTNCQETVREILDVVNFDQLFAIK